jgi:hypothetical protein
VEISRARGGGGSRLPHLQAPLQPPPFFPLFGGLGVAGRRGKRGSQSYQWRGALEVRRPLGGTAAPSTEAGAGSALGGPRHGSIFWHGGARAGVPPQGGAMRLARRQAPSTEAGAGEQHTDASGSGALRW